MGSELLVELSFLSGDENPASVTDTLRLPPTDSWLKGDQIGKTQRRRRRNGWRLTSRKETLEAGLEEVLSSVEPVAASLDLLRATWEIRLSAIVYAEGQMPVMFLPVDLVKRLAALEFSLDLDIYCLEADD